ncbi:hypothetical protein LUZ60_008164 [Juncus effusus]|nr:hypothetical protein LUZ60_008164 [Juncus effusus]
MAEHTRVDEYGNPILRVDEYGNPIRDQPSAYKTGGTGGGYGAGDYGTGTGTHGTTYPHEGVVAGSGAQHQPARDKVEGHGVGGVLHRSGSSSSSSSSEDDGMGGRRKKKSIKDKIKEKLPGTHKTETSSTTPITATGEHGYGTTGVHGQGTTGEHGYGTTGVHGGTTGYGGATATGEPEKKGLMEKIKEKLPGHN